MIETPSHGRPLLTVLMPAYNEEVGLACSVSALLAGLEPLGVAFELLIVDDGSRDRTGAIADELSAACPQVRVIHHRSNGGIGAGFRTGAQAARGEWMILVPADLALDLRELRKYLEAAARADVVVGNRSDRCDYSLVRLAVSWANIFLIRLLFGMPQKQFNYISMYRVDLLRRIDIQYWRSAFFFAEVLIKARGLGGQLVEVNINYVPRATGQASGAKPGLVARTVRDMFSFWFKWRTGSWINRPTATGPRANRNR
jgi:glycosyltransferase involved in cell wall biosynthesis